MKKQPTKRDFLEGFRGKANWRANRAMLLGLLVAFLYFKTGESSWTASVSKAVPLAWQLVALAAFLSLGARCASVFARTRVPTHQSRRQLPWLVLEVLCGFTFAILASSRHVLFYAGTILWAVISFAYPRVWARIKHTSQGEV